MPVRSLADGCTLGLILLAIGIAPVWTPRPAPPSPGRRAACAAPAATPPAAEKPDPAKSEPEKPAADDARRHDADSRAPTAEPKADAPATAASPAANPADDEYYELYQMFADTLDQVERNYVKPVSRRELMEAAIDGVLSKLDPYSSYISRDEIGRFKSTVESQFGGIGIQITLDRDQLKILSPLVGTPAYRAGLQAGDKILEIDGKPTDRAVASTSAVTRLKGEAGTSVTLTVSHAGEPTSRKASRSPAR